MKQISFSRLGLSFFLALSLSFWGCDNTLQESGPPLEIPEETAETPETESPEGQDTGDTESTEDSEDSEIAPELPIAPDEPDPETSPQTPDSSPSEGNETPEEETPPPVYPEITDFIFSPLETLRSFQVSRGKTIGTMGTPLGGTAPFSYFLVTGNESNGTDNDKFAIFGKVLKIAVSHMSAGTYNALIGIKDVNGQTHTKRVSVTIAPDPTAGEREIRTVNGVTFAMRYVPSGAYKVPERPYESQLIQISIPAGFWIAETEVTQALYKRIMGKNPSTFTADPAPGELQDQRPVERTNLWESIVFCNRLSILMGKKPAYVIPGLDWFRLSDSVIQSLGNFAMVVDYDADGFRLPTDEEWLWAAMGADKTGTGQVNETGYSKYYAGGLPNANQGGDYYQWILWNSDMITHEAGKLFPNELGIYDMSGNVSEMVYCKNGNTKVCGTTIVHPSDDNQLFWYALVTGEINPDDKAAEKYHGFRILSRQ